MRTISLEKVRLDLKLMRRAIKAEKLKAVYLYFSKDANYIPQMRMQLNVHYFIFTS